MAAATSAGVRHAGSRRPQAVTWVPIQIAYIISDGTARIAGVQVPATSRLSMTEALLPQFHRQCIAYAQDTQALLRLEQSRCSGAASRATWPAGAPLRLTVTASRVSLLAAHGQRAFGSGNAPKVPLAISPLALRLSSCCGSAASTPNAPLAIVLPTASCSAKPVSCSTPDLPLTPDSGYAAY